MKIFALRHLRKKHRDQVRGFFSEGLENKTKSFTKLTREIMKTGSQDLKNNQQAGSPSLPAFRDSLTNFENSIIFHHQNTPIVWLF